VFVTASVGIAVGGDAEELLRCSDVAMYGAKASGKAQYVVYAPRMDEHLVGRLELVADLRRADIESEFVLHYQPIVELSSGAVLGTEALVRWQHPSRGLLQPTEFIHLAEESGRILDIGSWVLREATRQTAEWQRRLVGAANLSVSVNVSTRQVRRPGLIEDVESALASSGLGAGHLTLELTETVLARRQDELTSILEELTAKGLRVALDDFGTGYSSLSRLKHLPVDVLKIDRSFVRDIPDDPQAGNMVQAVIQLATGLNMTPLAEGIETQDQWLFLVERGCRFGQGYYFSRPVPPDDILARQRRTAPV
jgi:EAL domain-containing protein (putative c-di-GMP-specific phosphodiesterase class I)